MDAENNNMEQETLMRLKKVAGKENAFTIPEGYFEELGDKIAGRIFLEEFKENHSADGFTVPEGYFEALEKHTLKSSKPAAKLRSIMPLIRYAAVACITITLGAALYFNSQSSTPEALLSTIPDEEIIKYLELNGDLRNDELIMENIETTSGLYDIGEGLSEEELNRYLDKPM